MNGALTPYYFADIQRRLEELETRGIAYDSGWIDVTFNTGWGNYGGAYGDVQYRKIGDWVHLRGLCERSSGTETDVFTLPTGYRPQAGIINVTIFSGSFGRIDIATDGDVEVKTGTYTYVSLANISFSTL